MALLDGANCAGTATLADTVALAVPDAVGAGAAPGWAVGPAGVWLLGAGALTLCSVVGAWDGADAGAVGGRLGGSSVG